MDHLTEDLLAIIYAHTTLRHPWKDRLSDWLLDLYQQGHVPTTRDLLDGLFLFRQSLLDTILTQPHLKDRVLASLNTGEGHRPRVGAPTLP